MQNCKGIGAGTEACPYGLAFILCFYKETCLINPKYLGQLRPSRFYDMPIVHESRFIMFEGVEVSNERRKVLNGWDLSLIQNIYDSLRSYGIGMQSLDHMIYDANQGVLKFKGYMDYVSKQDYSIVKSRLEAFDMQRSIVRAAVVDAEGEDFQRQNFNWSGKTFPLKIN